MAQPSSIEWTEVTWNPVTGCTKVSPGCAHCYAETFAERWRGVPGHAYENGFDLQLRPERLEQPLRWRKPRVVFVNSMSDLFHEDVSYWYIAAVFAVMAGAPRHTFQVLTKRPERMREILLDERFWRAVRVQACRGIGQFKFGVPHARVETPLPNVWLGTSIENRRFVDRADHLRAAPAAVRFISAEPLLGPLIVPRCVGRPSVVACQSASPMLSDRVCRMCPRRNKVRWDAELDLTAIDWLIAGGESGPGARRCDPEWLRDLRDACQASGTQFFLKQLGGHPRKRGGDEAVLDDVRWTQMPEVAHA